MTQINLVRLLELVKDYHMTDEEIEAQRRSFAYGNAKLANDSITKEDIAKAADAIKNDGGNVDGSD